VLREPSSSARRAEASPARPSKGAVKMKGLAPERPTIKRTQYSYAHGPAGVTPIVVEPASTGGSRHGRPSERERDYAYDRSARPQYFGEHGAGTVDPRYPQPSSPYENINYAAQPTYADVRFRPREYAGEKPSMQRSSTSVY
jgi:hypothetical protein